MTHEQKVESYKAALVEANIELKGKNSLYTSANGHMYSFLGKQDILAIRLPRDEQQKYNDKFGTRPVKQYGSEMRDYVEIIDSVASDVKVFANYLKKGLAYVKSLPSK